MDYRDKKILMHKWNAYNYLDVYQTFMQMGFQVDVFEELQPKSYDEDEVFAERFEAVMKKKKYDFIFTINYFGVISDICEQMQVPYISWSCDSPLIAMFHDSVFNSCNYIFLFDESNYHFFRAMGLKHLWHLPLAVDAKRITHILSEAEDLNLYQNTISFVGSLYERNTYDKLLPTFPEYLQGYFDCALEAQMNVCGGNLLELLLTDEICLKIGQYYHLEKSSRSFSDLRLIFATTVLGYKVAKEQRIAYLLELAKKQNVSIYTNSNTNHLVGINYRGSVDYWTEMPKVFYGSKINLNFTIPNIKTGVPLRIWDVLGAGGFLLTNEQAELETYFEIGRELVVFDGKKDLAKKVEYYLTHEAERREIARRGREKVLAEHSYVQRMKEMMGKI